MEEKLDYPEEFIERVVNAYPNNEVLHRLLKRGAADDVGKYLKTLTPQGVSVNKVLGAESLSELRDEALEILRKQRIYEDWKKIRRGQYPKSEP